MEKIAIEKDDFDVSMLKLIEKLNPDFKAGELSEDAIKHLSKKGEKIYREKIAIVYLVYALEIKGMVIYQNDTQYFENFVNDLVGTETENTRKLKNAALLQARAGLPIGSTSDNAMRSLESWFTKFCKVNEEDQQDEALKTVVRAALKAVDDDPKKLTSTVIEKTIQSKSLSLKDGVSATAKPKKGNKCKPSASPKPGKAGTSPTAIGWGEEDDDNGAVVEESSAEVSLQQIKKRICRAVDDWGDLITSNGKKSEGMKEEAKAFLQQQWQTLKSL